MSKNTFPVTMGRSGIQMVEQLRVYDLVWGTTGINRFCGMTDRKVSVAAHHLHCYNIADAWQPDNHKLKLYALVHDLPEAYYGDIHGAVKKLLGPDAMKVLSDIDETIFSQLGLSREDRIILGDDLHRIDVSALTLEAMYGFNKFEPYHWPPLDLYDDVGLIHDLCDGEDAIGFYTSVNHYLELESNHNEVLQELLYRNRSYSHPVRNLIR